MHRGSAITCLQMCLFSNLRKPNSSTFSSPGQVLHTNHLSSTPLDLLHFVIFPTVQGTALNAVSRYGLMSGNYWAITLPWICWLCCCSYSPRRCPFVARTHNWVMPGLPLTGSTFLWYCCRADSSQPVLLKGVSPCQGQDLLFLPAEHHEVLVSPILQPIKDGSPCPQLYGLALSVKYPLQT